MEDGFSVSGRCLWNCLAEVQVRWRERIQERIEMVFGIVSCEGTEGREEMQGFVEKNIFYIRPLVVCFVIVCRARREGFILRQAKTIAYLCKLQGN